MADLFNRGDTIINKHSLLEISCTGSYIILKLLIRMQNNLAEVIDGSNSIYKNSLNKFDPTKIMFPVGKSCNTMYTYIRNFKQTRVCNPGPPGPLVLFFLT